MNELDDTQQPTADDGQQAKELPVRVLLANLWGSWAFAVLRLLAVCGLLYLGITSGLFSLAGVGSGLVLSMIIVFCLPKFRSPVDALAWQSTSQAITPLSQKLADVVEDLRSEARARRATADNSKEPVPA